MYSFLLMYTPSYFRVESADEIHAFVKENGFATVVTAHKGQIITTHIPINITDTVSEQWILSGHVSRANPHWKAFAESTDTVIIFTGPHTYISSSRYEKPNVPTWNYTAVHCRGRIALMDDAYLRTSLRRLIAQYESPSSGLTFDSMPSDMVEHQLRGIVGFTMHVDTVEAKFKLSQNRSAADHATIIRQLRETGMPADSAVADLMTNYSPFS